jgi:hypothetical protein
MATLSCRMRASWFNGKVTDGPTNTVRGMAPRFAPIRITTRRLIAIRGGLNAPGGITTVALGWSQSRSARPALANRRAIHRSCRHRLARGSRAPIPDPSAEQRSGRNSRRRFITPGVISSRNRTARACPRGISNAGPRWGEQASPIFCHKLAISLCTAGLLPASPDYGTGHRQPRTDCEVADCPGRDPAPWCLKLQARVGLFLAR